MNKYPKFQIYHPSTNYVRMFTALAATAHRKEVTGKSYCETPLSPGASMESHDNGSSLSDRVVNLTRPALARHLAISKDHVYP